MNTTGKRHPVDMSFNDQNGSSLQHWFIQHLRTLLGSLYDPSILGKSPLLDWLNISQQPDSTAVLRKFLINAIDSLKPTEITPLGNKSSRLYEILRQRYIEQQTQRKVADNIGLSARQLQREEKIAIEILGETIWRTNDFQNRAGSISRPDLTSPLPSINLAVNQQQDLEWLKITTPAKSTNIDKEILDVLATLKGILKTNKIKVVYAPEKEDSNENLCLQAPILRQGLLNILGVSISLVPGGQINIRVNDQHHQMQIRIEAHSIPPKTIQLEPSQKESLDLATKLIALCEGTLLTSPGQLQKDTSDSSAADLVAVISLPVTEPITILFIEDNADALELYRRYLVDSRYRFVGARNASEGFSLAQKESPRIIVLDIMMPEKDGWSFLGQAKVHPKLQQVPIIISSVLKQASLAQTLGAADFLHKPVKRADLLSCLDRQLQRVEIKSH